MKRPFSKSLSDKILPVLDIKDGTVVQAIAGRRDSYRPIASAIVPSSVPVDVATAIGKQYRARRYYVADLNSLEGNPIQWRVIENLVSAGFELIVDANWWISGNLKTLLSSGPLRTVRPVFSSEGIVDWNSAANLLSRNPGFLFSLDLNDSTIVGDLDLEIDASLIDRVLTFIARLAEMSLSELILLDVANVGSNSGPRHLELLATIQSSFPELQLVSGGGVRNIRDVNAFLSAGCQQVLVGSAIHQNELA